jgi:hypothetical protein
MAAGMGSRYGGLKQIDPVGSHGEIIMDFSLYDAMLAGFEKAVFIIKKEMEEDMDDIMAEGAGKHLNIEYAFQTLDDIPDGFTVPEGRVKPWGTCHAVLAARDIIDGPIAVINADDYYGADSFQLMYDYLVTAKDDGRMRYSMIGYPLKNTLTEHGSVARGVCVVEDGFLTKIDERLKIMWHDGGIAYTEDDVTFVPVPEDSPVSMNFWGFTESFMEELKAGFPEFLKNEVPKNPLKAEYLLPTKVDELIRSGRATVRVINTNDRWYGVTYKEDKEPTIAALQSLKDNGVYPDRLWR